MAPIEEETYQEGGVTMQERLIREMVKLRGGPTKLKVLLKEYHEQITGLALDIEEAESMRDLIIQLTSVEEESQEEETE